MLSWQIRNFLIESGLHVHGVCDICAQKLKDYLSAQSIKGKHIRLKTTSNTRRGSGRIYDDGTQSLVTNNGYHEAIIIEINGLTMVFDNLYPEGKEITLWREDLVTEPGDFIEIEWELNF